MVWSGSVLVPVAVVGSVAVAIVDVVDVVTVLQALVAAAVAVLVFMLGMGVVVGHGHFRFLSVPCRTASCTMCATCSSARQ